MNEDPSPRPTPVALCLDVREPTMTRQSLIDAWERDRRLDAPWRLRERAEILDRLDAWWPEDGDGRGGDEPGRRGRALRTRLEAADAELFRTLREQIRRGMGAQALAPWSMDVADRCAGGDAYDHLDVLVSGVLAFGEPEPERSPLEPEMVFYQPTPARHVFDLVVRASISAQDVLFDLGSGLGHVPMLVSILSGARTVGIEWEPAYVACAERAARALHLDAVRFRAADARTADLSGGTVFYLYTPFRGAIMRDVLDALHAQAATRPIRVCTYGPCTEVVASQSWLHPEGPVVPDRVAIFRAGEGRPR